MKTVLFAHDGYISVTKNGIYSDTYDNKIVERYLDIAENVVFMVRTCEYQDDEKLNRISIKNFSIVGIENFKSFQGIFNYRTVTERVKLEVQKADYIVARVPSDLGFLAAKYAKKYKKRYMVEVVGCPWDSLRNHSILGKIIAPSYYLKQKRALKDSPYAIYVTNEFLQKRYPCGGMTIGCSDVEIEQTGKEIVARRIEKIKTTNMNSLVFGTMGALHMKYKGYDTVIKAIVKLNKEGYSHKYLIAGSGDSSWLKSIINKYNAENIVKIIPAMPHEKVFEWLDTIDVYIQPSKTEGMPRALIEAMSRACPCIGSDAGGIPELLSDKSVFKKNIYKRLYQLLRLNQEQLLNSSCDCFDRSCLFLNNLTYKKRMYFYKSFTSKKQENNNES